MTAIALIAVVLAVMLRSRAPWVFLAVTATALAVCALDAPFFNVGFYLAVLLAVFPVAVALPMNWTVLAICGVLAVHVVVTVEIQHSPFAAYDLLTSAGLTVGVAALGQTARARVAAVQASAQRALETQRARDARALQANAEKRLELARTLHDSLGHGIVAIGLYAQAAAKALKDRPEDALRSLQVVQDTAQGLIGDLSDMLEELRGGHAAAPNVGKGPGDIGELVRDASDLGADVSLLVRGQAVKVPPLVGLAAYEIAKESLLNARKYGQTGQPIEVVVAYGPKTLDVIVRNRVSLPPPAELSTGHGLVGMRERAQSVGGELAAGLRGPVFAVEANLPLHEVGS
jgi:signal transduction histidine kinase